MSSTIATARRERNWHAVHTRSRHEKVTAERLAEQGVERFLPLRRVQSRWADRKKWVAKPLFPGYLFVRIRADEVPVANGTQGVVRLLGTEASGPSVVPDVEVESIRRLVAGDLPVDSCPYLKPGRRVTITHGPLRGVEGELIREARRCFIVVSVQLLGRSVAAEVPGNAVRPL